MRTEACNHFHERLHPAGVVLSILLFVFSIAAGEAPDFSSVISQISQKIDSLDLLKQDLKRRGKTIAEIELQQTVFRDSLRQLHKTLQASAPSLSGLSEKKGKSLFPPKPANFFDWIIIVTGIIASFSGLMLIIGISRMLTLRRKYRIRQTPQLYQNHPSPPVPAEKPAAEIRNDLKPSPVPSPKSKERSDPGSLDLLRERIDQQQTLSIADAESPALPGDVFAAAPDTTDKSIEETILSESRKGSDVATISRKHHLSADHVALILKMAVKKSKLR